MARHFCFSFWICRYFGVLDLDTYPMLKQKSFSNCNYNAQIIRSVSQWSAGTSQDEDSIHRAYCALIEQAEHFIYIEVAD